MELAQVHLYTVRHNAMAFTALARTQKLVQLFFSLILPPSKKQLYFERFFQGLDNFIYFNFLKRN